MDETLEQRQQAHQAKLKAAKKMTLGNVAMRMLRAFQNRIKAAGVLSSASSKGSSSRRIHTKSRLAIKRKFDGSHVAARRYKRATKGVCVAGTLGKTSTR